jgi:hypothetical protein
MIEKPLQLCTRALTVSLKLGTWVCHIVCLAGIAGGAKVRVLVRVLLS